MALYEVSDALNTKNKHESKQAHYDAKIKDNSHNQTLLFLTTSKLLQMNTACLYPSSVDDSDLTNVFA